MLDIHFLTSSRAKFNHIQYLLRNYAINLKSQSEYGRAYNEPRIFDREKLLEASIKDANTRLARSLKYAPLTNIENQSELTIDELALKQQEKLFIIEDTSVSIEALSVDREFPGVDIKYWMREITFENLDSQLRSKGNNRRVSVRSDIVIYLPPSFRNDRDNSFFKIFTGITHGVITEKEFNFNTNPVHPWLDNKTFNKWFIPEFEKKPISMLSINKAEKYDFRKKAIDHLISYLQENALTNLKKTRPERTPFQAELFEIPSLILCGATCAGKTILAQNISDKYGHYHIEASDFMHLAYYRKHGFRSTVNIHEFALNALKDNPSVVSDQINDHLELIGNAPVFITGFRCPDELKVFDRSARVFNKLFIESNLETRFQRSISRARNGHAKSFDEFKAQDELQLRMGLLDIKKSNSFETIENESTISRYFSEVESRYFSNIKTKSFDGTKIHRILEGSNLSLEESILIALFIESDNEMFYTTSEIAKLINTTLPKYRKHQQHEIKTDKNNVSRYFNQRLYPYYETSVSERITRFRLSITGASHTTLLLKQIVAR